MKFIAASAVIALWTTGNTVDAIFATPKNGQILASSSYTSGWLMRDVLRGGSMGKCQVLSSFHHEQSASLNVSF